MELTTPFRYTIQVQLGPVVNPFSATLTWVECTTIDPMYPVAATIWTNTLALPFFSSTTAAYTSSSDFPELPQPAYTGQELISESEKRTGAVVGMVVLSCVVVIT
jgi:hypothetical protein